MKKGYIDGISDILNAQIFEKRRNAYKEKHFLEVALMQAAINDSLLRGVLFRKGYQKGKLLLWGKYWDNPDIKFSTLINNYELMEGEKNLVKALTRYNKDRNKIVHEMLFFKNFEELDKVARANADEGYKIQNKLMNEMVKIKLPKKSEPMIEQESP